VPVACGLLPDKKLENECRAAALPPRAATCSGLFLQSTVKYIPYLYNANLTPTNMATSTDRIRRLPNLADSISRNNRTAPRPRRAWPMGSAFGHSYGAGSRSAPRLAETQSL